MTGSTSLDILMILTGGLLGSAHCVGMCGGFVLTLGAEATTWSERLSRQIVYALGRVSVYAFAGAVAGFAGWKLEASTRSLINLQAIVSVVAGVLLVVEGARSLGWLPRWTGTGVSCPLASLGALLRSKNWSAIFAAGVWNGFLPCGLVYAYIALAATTQNIALGALVMMIFGLGTIPALALTGMAGSALRVAWRRHIFTAAAVCLLLTGVLTIVRGVSFLEDAAGETSPRCPLCSR